MDINNILRINFPNGQFVYGVKDLLGAPVDAIVNPANSGLSHGGGLAAIISEAAGEKFDDDCEKLIRKFKKIPVTLAVPATAGNLSFKGIINAVGPRMGDGDEQKKIETTIKNSLLIAEKMGWKSIAFPAISTGIFGVPKEVCAKAFRAVIEEVFGPDFVSSVRTIWLCLTTDDVTVFQEIFGSKSQQNPS